MRVLFIDQLRRNPERVHKTDNQAIMGARVFEWSLISNLLEYGTYDAYFAPAVTDQGKDELVQDGVSREAANRLTPVLLGHPLPIKDSDQAIFLTAGRYLDFLATLRQKVKRYDAPICGFIHSINSARIALALLEQCFVGLSEADLLLCSSRAGKRTIDLYVDEVNRLLSPAFRYPARRVLVPLAVSIPTIEPEARAILRQRLHLDGQSNLALYLGRLSQSSKCDLGPLLVALSQLSGRGSSLHLVIAGDDTQTNEAPRLQSLASALGCHERLTIWPNPSADEKHLLYSGADMFVSPSDNLQETFGLSVAEAMAYGLPSIVSDWDGYRDLVKDGETGFLIPSFLPPGVETLRLCDCATSMMQEDSLAQSTAIDVGILSERLERLANDRVARRRMGLAARHFIENSCSWQVVVKRYEELWGEASQIAKKISSNGKPESELLTASLEKCFGHYASAKRGGESKCFITPEGREWLKRPDRFYFLSQLTTGPCPQKFARMLRRVSDCPGLSVASVVESCEDGSDPDSLAHALFALARLFKYGLVSDVQTS